MHPTVLALILLLAAVASRLIPHPPNFTPLAAMALTGGIYLDRRWALLLPLGAMFLSDMLLGFHTGIPFVYGSFLVIGVLGLWLRTRKGILTGFAGLLAGSVLFYVVTNFGVWFLQTSMYPKTIEGLAACYIAALPFFRNALAGDLVYGAVLFGLYEAVQRLAPGEGKASVHQSGA